VGLRPWVMGKGVSASCDYVEGGPWGVKADGRCWSGCVLEMDGILPGKGVADLDLGGCGL
jgi:hypothetical protein